MSEPNKITNGQILAACTVIVLFLVGQAIAGLIWGTRLSTKVDDIPQVIALMLQVQRIEIDTLKERVKATEDRLSTQEIYNQNLREKMAEHGWKSSSLQKENLPNAPYPGQDNNQLRLSDGALASHLLRDGQYQVPRPRD